MQRIQTSKTLLLLTLDLRPRGCDISAQHTKFIKRRHVIQRVFNRVQTCLGVLHGTPADKSTIDMKLWILVANHVVYH